MTKKSLLPETDLARIALLPDNEKREQLIRVKLGQPKFTYAPVRQAVPVIFNARPNLLELNKAKWEDIDAAIRKISVKRPNSIDPNLAVAKPLFDYASEKAFVAIERDFMAVPIGRGAKVKFWHDFYFIKDGKPVICFVDPRQMTKLNQRARDFVFSVMHHNLARGDFAGADFQIFHFLKGPGDTRIMGEPHNLDMSRLIDEDVINKAIDTTYNMWFDVLAEREDEARQNPQTGTGGLFGW